MLKKIKLNLIFLFNLLFFIPGILVLMMFHTAIYTSATLENIVDNHNSGHWFWKLLP